MIASGRVNVHTRSIMRFSLRSSLPLFRFRCLASVLLLLFLAEGNLLPKARDIGVSFEGVPGSLNAITDVAGVTVGHSTIVKGRGQLKVGKGPVRTGVTAIFPLGTATLSKPVFGGVFALNGNGEVTGAAWLEESGFLEGPIVITNTHSVGMTHHSVITWRTRQAGPDATGYWWSLPVVAETWDGYLNDINGFHVKERHVFEALESAAGGPVAEGNVGGGTGMICYEFKGGIGTSSRVLQIGKESYIVGVLVQANCGRREQLLVSGVSVGREIPEHTVKRRPNLEPSPQTSSIIIVVATNAPLLPHQLKRVARRASLGLARTGSISSNGSGDFFIAFSTRKIPDAEGAPTRSVEMISNGLLNPLFTATVQATEEAIINALVAAKTMVGRDNRRVIALPHDRLREILRKYNRLGPAAN